MSDANAPITAALENSAAAAATFSSSSPSSDAAPPTSRQTTANGIDAPAPVCANGERSHGQPSSSPTPPPPPQRPRYTINYCFMPGYLSYVAPDKIDDGLYLGGLSSTTNRDELKALNVEAILTVAGGLGNPAFPDDFEYTVVAVEDAVCVDLSKHFDACFAAINVGRAKGGVLVHCLAGMSRSVTITVAYLMKTKNMNLKKALAHVKKCRPVAQPNMGFMRQLEQFDALLETSREKGRGWNLGRVCNI